MEDFSMQPPKSSTIQKRGEVNADLRGAIEELATSKEGLND